jgi:FAD/FMN-containing dehydrogenase
MTQTTHLDVGALRARLSGPVLTPQDAEYDEARILWNGAISRRPAVIAQPRTAAEVSAAVLFARDNELEIAVRGGAHSTPGLSGVDDGLVVDLRLMRDVTVDPESRRARVGGGATLGDKDAATLAHGLASTGGIVGHTGVGGITLVGGMGWLTRKAGLALAALVSAEVVTADGRVLRAAEDENADLFWALRGGGGNFGVVTSFEFELVEVDPTVQFGLFFWDLDHGPDALRVARDVVATLPEGLSVILGGVNAPPAPFVPEQHRLQPGYVLLLTGFGDPVGHEAVAERIRRDVPPLFEFVTEMPYVQLQQLFDEANPFGIHCYDKGLYLSDLTDEVIAVIAEHLGRKESPESVLFLYRLDGAYSRVGEDDTAFGGGRSPRYTAFILGMGWSQEVLARETEWVRALREALSPHAMESGSYLNGEADLGQARVRASYGHKLERLARVKATYDPDNVFHRTANIRPAVPA